MSRCSVKMISLRRLPVGVEHASGSFAAGRSSSSHLRSVPLLRTVSARALQFDAGSRISASQFRDCAGRGGLVDDLSSSSSSSSSAVVEVLQSSDSLSSSRGRSRQPVSRTSLPALGSCSSSSRRSKRSRRRCSDW